MENKIDVQKLLQRLQSQIGAQAIKITLLEMEIERLNLAMPQPVPKKENDNE